MEWHVDLEGGPADGDTGAIDSLPPKLWVELCSECNEWHWYSEPEQGCEVYARQQVYDDERKAKYVFRDIDLDGLEQLDREAELLAA